MKKKYLFYEFIKTLEDSKITSDHIFGMSFFLGCRLGLILESDFSGDIDSEKFGSERFDKFFNEELGARINGNYKNNYEIEDVIQELLLIFRWFGFKLDFKLREKRLNIEGQPTDLLSPKNTLDILNDESIENRKLLSDIHVVFDVFFNLLGKALKKIVKNNEGAFAFSTFFLQRVTYQDQHGFQDFLILFKRFAPPFYSVILDPISISNYCNPDRDFDYYTFHIILTGFLSGLPSDVQDIVWNEQRIIFYDQETKKIMRGDLQFTHLSDSLSFFDSFIEKRLLNNEVKKFYKTKIDIFDNEHNQLKNFKIKNNLDVYENLYKNIFIIVKKRWGFDINSSYSSLQNITFLVTFYFTLIYSYIANIERFKE